MGKSGLGSTFRFTRRGWVSGTPFDFGGSHRVMPGQRTMNTTQTMMISMKILR
jgi:hypothetical protein